jgi:hypothetical protein
MVHRRNRGFAEERLHRQCPIGEAVRRNLHVQDRQGAPASGLASASTSVNVSGFFTANVVEINSLFS